MKASEIWSFSIDGIDGLFRVVLNIKDLDLDVYQPMSNMQDCSLVQICEGSSYREDTFKPENLLFNGVIVYGFRATKALGLRKVASEVAQLGDVEFPGWFINGRECPQFYRGEVNYAVQDYTFEFIHENWRILLGATRLEKLGWLISDYKEYLASIKAGSPKRGIGAYRHDIRYNVKKDEILKAIGVSFSEPYHKVLAEKCGPERVAAYTRALSPL